MQSLNLNFGTDLRTPVPDKPSEIVWFGTLTLTNHKKAHNFFTSGNLAFFLQPWPPAIRA